jgi:putative colanic acid biosynthesis acetyltransferase WcaF
MTAPSSTPTSVPASTPGSAPGSRQPAADSAAKPYLAAEISSDPRDRHRSPYSTGEKVRRIVWAVVQATLFRLSFHNFYGWRNLLLRVFGARLHPSVRIRRTARIECPWNLTMGANSSFGDFVIAYCLGPVTIGNRVSISQYAHLCAGSHDYTQPNMPLLRPPITIEDDVWIAADAFVGPGITVGQGAILGARGVALKSLKPWTIYLGNPAQGVRPRPPIASAAKP